MFSHAAGIVTSTRSTYIELGLVQVALLRRQGRGAGLGLAGFELFGLCRARFARLKDVVGQVVILDVHDPDRVEVLVVLRPLGTLPLKVGDWPGDVE